MSDCIFCKIVKGEIPCQKILESKDFLAFMDIRPVNPGHVLIVPKHHCENILDFPKTEETDFVEFIKKSAKAVVRGVDAHGFNLGMNNGEAAGQVVFHAHMHIIPRFNNDGLISWPHKNMTKEEMDKIYKKIISHI